MNLASFLTSFRFRIILTLILVIASFSLISFFVYNSYLSNLIYKDAENDFKTMMGFLQKQIIAARDGRKIKPLLIADSKSSNILRSFILDDKGKLKFSSDSNRYKIKQESIKEIMASRDEIFLKSFRSWNTPFSRASVRFVNSPRCYGCHSPTVKTIGYIVVDFSLQKSDNTIAFTRKFSIFFTIIMVLLILGFVMVLHYRFVKRSLSQFKVIINTINKGDLSKRVIIPKSKELAELGSSFNTMVDQFQQTQFELQKYHEKEIKNTQRLATIGEMSARLAHEIRNPMTGIANAVEIIIDETKNEHNKSILEEIRRQANRVNKAVSNLLKFSQTKELNLHKYNINEIIRSVVFFLENQATQKKIHFELDLDSQLPDSLFDPEQMENVLLNLGINAMQASYVDGTVFFRTAYDPLQKRIAVSVSDMGSGIPDDIIEEVFTPFYTTRTEGTGLGLAIVKDIVEMHKGKINVKNNPDNGCTFQIFLHTDWNDPRF